MIRWDLVKWHKRGTFLLQASVLYMEVAVEVFLWREDPVFPLPSGCSKAQGARPEQVGVPCPKDTV